MVTETHGFIRILPDGSGKRVPHTVMVEAQYVNGIHDFKVGDTITGSVSGLVAVVLEVRGTTASGELHMLLPDPVPANPAFTLNEDLVVLGLTYAQSNGVTYPYYFQQTNISGGKTPTNLLEVDLVGAAYTRFAEGSPQFDAFGKLQISNQFILAEYLNVYGIDTDKVSVNTVGGATATHLPESAGILLTCGTASGDKAEVVSHYYHPYSLGQSRLIEFTNAAGDIGKTNLVRSWGYGDDFNGVFFTQVSGAFGAMIRSSVPGSQDPLSPGVTEFNTGSVDINNPTYWETFIPQSAWNADKLDGSKSSHNLSQKAFDVTKDNITWMDLQWLGAGTVRFGVVIDGVRITAHQWHHSNGTSVPYMKTATLPIYLEQKNIGVTASGSEFRIWCTVVKNEGDFNQNAKDFSITVPTTTLAASTTNRQLVTAFRASQLYKGQTNRKSGYLKSVQPLVIGDHVILEIWRLNDPTTQLVGGFASTNVSDPESSIEFTQVGTLNLTSARLLKTIAIHYNSSQEYNLSEVFNTTDEGCRRHFDSANYHAYAVTARRAISSSLSCTVIPALCWDEI